MIYRVRNNERAVDVSVKAECDGQLSWKVLKGSLVDVDLFAVIGQSTKEDEAVKKVFEAYQNWLPVSQNYRIDKYEGFSGCVDWVVKFQHADDVEIGYVRSKKIFHSTMSGYAEVEGKFFIGDLMRLMLVEKRFGLSFMDGKYDKPFVVLKERQLENMEGSHNPNKWLEEELQMLHVVSMEMTKEEKFKAGTMVTLTHWPSEDFLKALEEEKIFAVAVIYEDLSGINVYQTNGVYLGEVKFNKGEEAYKDVEEKITRIQQNHGIDVVK